MSDIAKTIGAGIGYTVGVIIALVAVIALLAVIVGWLLPIATLGAFAPGFVPCVAIVTLAALLRATTAK